MRKEQVKAGGRDFEVQELTIGQALPIIPRMSGEGSAQAQIELLDASVTESGNAVLVAELPFSMFTPLLEAAMRVNGFASGED